MKNVTVLYFAGVRELTGIADEQLRVTDGVGSVQGLLAYLVRQRPELRGRLAGVRVARNETFDPFFSVRPERRALCARIAPSVSATGNSPKINATSPCRAWRQ